MNAIIASLLAALDELGAEAEAVTVHKGQALPGGEIEVRIRAATEAGAAALAAMLGCTERREAGSSGYVWTQHRTPGFWEVPLNIEVSGPHRRVASAEAA